MMGDIIPFKKPPRNILNTDKPAFLVNVEVNTENINKISNWSMKKNVPIDIRTQWKNKKHPSYGIAVILENNDYHWIPEYQEEIIEIFDEL